MLGIGSPGIRVKGESGSMSPTLTWETRDARLASLAMPYRISISLANRSKWSNSENLEHIKKLWLQQLICIPKVSQPKLSANMVAQLNFSTVLPASSSHFHCHGTLRGPARAAPSATRGACCIQRVPGTGAGRAGSSAWAIATWHRRRAISTAGGSWYGYSIILIQTCLDTDDI
jgi:hypothetical protein